MKRILFLAMVALGSVTSLLAQQNVPHSESPCAGSCTLPGANGASTACWAYVDDGHERYRECSNMGSVPNPDGSETVVVGDGYCEFIFAFGQWARTSCEGGNCEGSGRTLCGGVYRRFDLQCSGAGWYGTRIHINTSGGSCTGTDGSMGSSCSSSGDFYCYGNAQTWND
jgi:hypothetical protein